MSGPMQPAMNQILRLPQGQTRKPMGDQRVPMTPGPVPRSDMSRRIIAARQAGVRPEQITQQPGYAPKGADPMRPGKGDPLSVPSAPMPRPQPQVVPQATPVQPPVAGPIPMPRARPPEAGLGEDPRAIALREAFLRSRGVENDPTRMNSGNAIPPPDPTQASALRDSFIKSRGLGPDGSDPAMAAAKEQLAKAMIQRFGGGTQTAPAARGGVTPPPPLPAQSPSQAPPPVGYAPITAPNSEYVIRAPELEGKEGKKTKPQKSTRTTSEAYGANPRYYHILGVEVGDNVGAARAKSKLEAKMKEDPQSLTREEYELLASSSKVPAFNKSRKEEDIQKFFKDAYGPDEAVPEEKRRGKGAKDDSRVSNTGPAPGGSYATRVPPEGSFDSRFAMPDPAVAQAYAAIGGAGRFVPPPLPTQESVNAQKKFNPQEDVAPLPGTEEEGD